MFHRQAKQREPKEANGGPQHTWQTKFVDTTDDLSLPTTGGNPLLRYKSKKAILQVTWRLVADHVEVFY